MKKGMGKEIQMDLNEGDEFFDVDNDGGNAKVKQEKMQDNISSNSEDIEEDDQNSSEVRNLVRDLIAHIDQLISIVNNRKCKESDREPTDNLEKKELEQEDNEYSPKVRFLLVQLIDNVQKFVWPFNEHISIPINIKLLSPVSNVFSRNPNNQNERNCGLGKTTDTVDDNICDSECKATRISLDCDQRNELEQSKESLRNSAHVECLLDELLANIQKLICPPNQCPARPTNTLPSLEHDSCCKPDLNCDNNNDLLTKPQDKKTAGTVICKCCYNAYRENKNKNGIFDEDVRKPKNCTDKKLRCKAINNMEDGNKTHSTPTNMFKNILNQSKNDKFLKCCAEIKENHLRSFKEEQCNGRRHRLDETLIEVLSTSTRRKNMPTNGERCATICGYNICRKQFNNSERKDSFEEVKTMKNTINRGLLQVTSKLPSTQKKKYSCNQRKKSSFPATITSVRPLGRRSLLVDWKIHSHAGLGGYEVNVDGCPKTKLFSSIHDSTCVFDVDVGEKHVIVLHPIPKTNDKSLGNGRCSGFVENSSSWSPSTFYYDPACLPAGN